MWLRQHWLGILGCLPFVPAIAKWLGKIVGWGGNTDFLISRSQEPGWVGAMIGWLLDPPAWSILPMIVVGLGLIYYDSVRARTPRAGDRKQQIKVASEAVSVSDAITRELIRWQQTTPDLPTGSDPRALADQSFAQHLATKRAVTIAGTEFGRAALKAIKGLERLGIASPQFTEGYAPNMPAPPLERVLSFHLTEVSRYLGVVGQTLLDDDLDAAKHAAKGWSTVAASTPPLPPPGREIGPPKQSPAKPVLAAQVTQRVAIRPAKPANASATPEPPTPSPPNRWAKYGSVDLERIDSALYAMHQVISDARAKVYEPASHLGGNFIAYYSDRKAPQIAAMKTYRELLVAAIQSLHDIQYREYSFYREDLQSVYDNAGLSDGLGTIDAFRHLLEGSPDNLGSMQSVLAEKFSKYQVDMGRFGTWLARSFEKVKSARDEVAAIKAGA